MTKENVKQILLTIFIGAVINIITVLSQYAIEWLRTIPPELPGTIVGVTKYLMWLNRPHA